MVVAHGRISTLMASDSRWWRVCTSHPDTEQCSCSIKSNYLICSHILCKVCLEAWIWPIINASAVESYSEVLVFLLHITWPRLQTCHLVLLVSQNCISVIWQQHMTRGSWWLLLNFLIYNFFLKFPVILSTFCNRTFDW